MKVAEKIECVIGELLGKVSGVCCDAYSLIQNLFWQQLIPIFI